MTTTERLRELEKKATAGPWRWRNCVGSRGVSLVHPGSGMLLVMDAVRHGMSGADVRFAERTDNMGGLMHKATELLPKPGRGVSDYPPITNPDMRLMVECRNALPSMLAVIEAAEALHAAMNIIIAYDLYEHQQAALKKLESALAAFREVRE